MVTIPMQYSPKVNDNVQPPFRQAAAVGPALGGEAGKLARARAMVETFSSRLKAGAAKSHA
jgi:hypothetical protein